eukprot:Awhi_evm1s10241
MTIVENILSFLLICLASFQVRGEESDHGLGHWGDYISEEIDRGSSYGIGKRGHTIRGFHCKGASCYKLTPFYGNEDRLYFLDLFRWSPYTGSNNAVYCDNDHVMVSFQCKDSYCSHIRIMCNDVRVLPGWKIVDTWGNNASWKQCRFSEKHSTSDCNWCPSGSFACNGYDQFCDVPLAQTMLLGAHNVFSKKGNVQGLCEVEGVPFYTNFDWDNQDQEVNGLLQQ